MIARPAVRILAVALPAVLLALSAATPASASDKSTLRTLVVTKTDVGKGYTAEAGTADPDLFPMVAACVGRPVTGRTVTANLDGPDLTRKADGATVDSSAQLLQTAAMVQSDIAIVQDPKFADCLASTSQAQAASQGVTRVVTQTVQVKPYGDFSRAFLSQVTATGSSGPVSATIVTVYFARGRAELDASFGTYATGAQPPAAFSQDDAQKILDKVAKRLKQAKVG